MRNLAKWALVALDVAIGIAGIMMIVAGPIGLLRLVAGMTMIACSMVWTARDVELRP